MFVNTFLHLDGSFMYKNDKNLEFSGKLFNKQQIIQERFSSSNSKSHAKTFQTHVAIALNPRYDYILLYFIMELSFALFSVEIMKSFHSLKVCECRKHN